MPKHGATTVGADRTFCCCLWCRLGRVAAWAFVQSVGGIAVGQPIRNAGQWILPVRANVSGVEAITTQPAQFGLGVRDADSGRG